MRMTFKSVSSIKDIYFTVCFLDKVAKVYFYPGNCSASVSSLQTAYTTHKELVWYKEKAAIVY